MVLDRYETSHSASLPDHEAGVSITNGGYDAGLPGWLCGGVGLSKPNQSKADG